MNNTVYMIVPFVAVVVSFAALAFVVLVNRKSKQQAERAITDNLLEQLYELNKAPSNSTSSSKLDEIALKAIAPTDSVNYSTAFGEIESAKCVLAKDIFMYKSSNLIVSDDDFSGSALFYDATKRHRKSFHTRTLDLRKQSV